MKTSTLSAHFKQANSFKSLLNCLSLLFFFYATDLLHNILDNFKRLNEIFAHVCHCMCFPNAANGMSYQCTLSKTLQPPEMILFRIKLIKARLLTCVKVIFYLKCYFNSVTSHCFSYMGCKKSPQRVHFPPLCPEMASLSLLP